MCDMCDMCDMTNLQTILSDSFYLDSVFHCSWKTIFSNCLVFDSKTFLSTIILDFFSTFHPQSARLLNGCQCCPPFFFCHPISGVSLTINELRGQKLLRRLSQVWLCCIFKMIMRLIFENIVNIILLLFFFNHFLLFELKGLFSFYFLKLFYVLREEKFI